MSLNNQKVKEQFESIKKMVSQGSNEFYVALCLFDMTQIEESDIDEELINLVNKTIEEYDSIYNESLRDNVDDKRDEKYLSDLTKYIDNYCENCTDQEWNDLLDDYCIVDQENYMGEVRRNLDDAIEIRFSDCELEERREMLDFFKKYYYKEKSNINIDDKIIDKDEEIEK